MNLIFNIAYRANWGETVCIIGNCPELGLDSEVLAARMHAVDDDHWQLRLSIHDDTAPDVLNYSFLVRGDKDKTVRKEWRGHSLQLQGHMNLSVEVVDTWTDEPQAKMFYLESFSKGILFQPLRKLPHNPTPGTVIFSVTAPYVLPTETVAIVGNSALLGNWNAQHALPMTHTGACQWSIPIDLSTLSGTLEYKFVIIETATKKTVLWEDGPNRAFRMPFEPADVTVVASSYMNFTRQPWRGAGVAIPVFSLRTDEDYGVGDFADLYQLVDWAQATGQHVIQLLPINDTTATNTIYDSYPYSAISSFALHPMYLRPDLIGRLDDKSMEVNFRDLGAKINKLETVDYVKANGVKQQYLRELYKQLGEKALRTPHMRKFISDNASWLKPYAAFCILRAVHGTPKFETWGEDAEFTAEKLQQYEKKYAPDMGYIYFLQYHLHKQLHEVVRYARSKNVILKGDVPIGVSRYSADTWQNPELFNMYSQAGAPPDDFATDGQNWGFPTYNWQQMQLDGYQWWKQRFKKMSEFFDAYRIDHILGFFRIWQVPYHAFHGMLGTFYPAMPLSPEEMKWRYGFNFYEALHTTPLLTKADAEAALGDAFADVKSRFLRKFEDGLYTPQKFVDTQREVHELFWHMEDYPEKEITYKTLMSTIDDVLFISDPTQPGLFHPRFNGNKTTAYALLPDDQKQCFDALYHDFFYKRHNEFWKRNALQKLPQLVDCTDMISCGEDLGMIPESVPEVMAQLQILSLEVQRMPKTFDKVGYPERYPYLCVATTSTHDMSGIRGWWDSFADRQWFYNSVLKLDGEAPEDATPDICYRIIKQHLASPAIFTILPLQDWLAIDAGIRREDFLAEQINRPEIQNHYWCYRMHITLKELLEADELNAKIRHLIQASGR